MLWSDGSKEATLDAPIIKGKRIAVCHTFIASGLIENTLLLFGKKYTLTTMMT